MPSLTEHDDDPHPQPDRGNRRLMVPVILVVVVMIFVLLHLTGVLGPGRAQKAVAISFFLLAPYIAQDAIRALIAADHPSTSWVGIGLSLSSIVVMPLLGRAKQRIGERLGSGATAGEGCACVAVSGPEADGCQDACC